MHHVNKPNLLGTLVPILIAIFVMLLEKTPTILLFDVVPNPSLLLIVVFFWTDFGETRLSLFVLFCIGLLEDVLSGTPLGLWAFVFLLIYFFMRTRSAPLITKDFFLAYIIFAIVTLVAYILVFWGISLHAYNTPILSVLIVPYIITLTVFPFCVRVLMKIENWLSHADI